MPAWPAELACTDDWTRGNDATTAEACGLEFRGLFGETRGRNVLPCPAGPEVGLASGVPAVAARARSGGQTTRCMNSLMTCAAPPGLACRRIMRPFNIHNSPARYQARVGFASRSRLHAVCGAQIECWNPDSVGGVSGIDLSDCLQASSAATSTRPPTSLYPRTYSSHCCDVVVRLAWAGACYSTVRACNPTRCRIGPRSRTLGAGCKYC